MISNYLSDKIQNSLFIGGLFTPPTKYYMALSKTPPNPDGSNVEEPSGSEYARIVFDRGSVDFNNSINGVVTNKLRKEYAETTSVWGTCTHYAIYDAQTGGNLLWAGELLYSRDIDIDMQLFINPNDLIFALS